jgi:glycosyltransferase involved in cell wall biosynthesis
VHQSMNGVSVIIPCYNGAKYLRQTLQSVLAQDFGGSMDVIVADDGSTDGSQVIAESFAPQVTFLPSPDASVHSLPATRNRAIMESQSPFIAFLDADDLWLPCHVASLASAMAADPDLGLACDDGFYIDDLGKNLGIIIPPSSRPSVTAESMLVNCFTDPSGVMVRRSAITRVGAFSEQLRYAEDHDLWLRILETCRGAYVPSFGYCYRLHSTQMSGNPMMWDYAEEVLARAIARYPYKRRVVRKRRAVLAYRHSQIAFRSRRMASAFGLICKAALLDPPRAAKELFLRARILRRLANSLHGRRSKSVRNNEQKP